MKKFLSIIVALIVATAGMTVAAQLQYDPICQKYAKKAAKNMAKQMKKGKWQFSGSMAVQDKLEQYYLKTSECGRYEDNSKTVSHAKTIITGENSASSALATEITKNIFQKVAGASAGEISSETEESVIDKFKILYQSDLAACIERSATFYRKNLNGTYELTVLFLVNKENKERLERKAVASMSDDRWRSIIEDVDNAHGN